MKTYRVTTANLNNDPVQYTVDHVVAESQKKASVMVENMHHHRGFTNRCEVECEELEEE